MLLFVDCPEIMGASLDKTNENGKSAALVEKKVCVQLKTLQVGEGRKIFIWPIV